MSDVQHLIRYPQAAFFDTWETRCGIEIQKRAAEEVEDLPICGDCQTARSKESPPKPHLEKVEVSPLQNRGK